jgi:hypothetical protein
MFIGTLACMMIASIAGFMDTGNPSILGIPAPEAIEAPAPADNSNEEAIPPDATNQTPPTTAPTTPGTPSNTGNSN